MSELGGQADGGVWRDPHLGDGVVECHARETRVDSEPGAGATATLRAASDGDA